MTNLSWSYIDGKIYAYINGKAIDVRMDEKRQAYVLPPIKMTQAKAGA